MKTTHRWSLYFVAAVVTGAGMVYVDRPASDPGAPAGAIAMPSKPRAAQASAAIWKLPRREMAPISADPFGSDDTAAAEQAVGQDHSAPTASIPPAQTVTPPPLPFTYVGQWAEKGAIVAFLMTQQGINIAARAGATIDGEYRVERIDEQGMTLLYLPLNARQMLSFVETRGTATTTATVPGPADSAGTEETN